MRPPTSRETRNRKTDPETLPLTALDAVFVRWLGAEYDLDAIHAALAAVAALQLDGDPVWLLLVSGPGNAKTETVAALQGAGAHVVSSIASEGALLSGTSKGERTNEATGGLLCTIGKRGVLVLKDFTSILSLAQSTRPGVLAALREIYDGRWVRSVGVDGGRILEWEGRIAIIGAVTTSWDSKHESVAAMGDRFVLLRLDSTRGRLSSGRQAIANTGNEAQMRDELQHAVRMVINNASTIGSVLYGFESERILEVADLVTMGRTAVSRDRSGNIIDAHAPEAPTRFAKQMTQLVRGGLAVGMGRSQAMNLAIRCARDSLPPLRLLILSDLALHGESLVNDIRKRLDRPRSTVDRELQALQMLKLVTLRESTDDQGTRWYYSIRPDVKTAALFPEIEVPPQPLEDRAVALPTAEDFSMADQAQGPTSFSGIDAALDSRGLVARGKAVSENLR